MWLGSLGTAFYTPPVDPSCLAVLPTPLFSQGSSETKSYRVSPTLLQGGPPESVRPSRAAPESQVCRIPPLQLKGAAVEQPMVWPPV